MLFVETSLQTLCDAHEGDNHSALADLIKERSSLTGWEAWTSLLREQLAMDGCFEEQHSLSVNGNSNGSSDGNTVNNSKPLGLKATSD